MFRAAVCAGSTPQTLGQLLCCNPIHSDVRQGGRPDCGFRDAVQFRLVEGIAMTLSFYVQEGRMAIKDVKFEPVDAGPNGILSPDRLLSRGLGVRSIVFMVVAGAAPMTAVVAGWPVVVSASGSTGGPLFFLIATTILFLFAVGFTRMTPFVKN